MNFARLRSFLMVILTLSAARGMAADEATTTNLQEEVRLLRARLDGLEKQLADLNARQAAATPTGTTVAVAVPAATPAPMALLALPSNGGTVGRAASAYMNMSFDIMGDAGWSSTRDAKDIQPGGHDPAQRGFSLRNAELTLDGNVDPYFKAFANVVMFTQPDESTGLELEEAYVLSTGLPDDLQLKLGRFFAEFGRQNNQHPHAWSFVDEPLVLNRMFGEDGLRQNGARLSWLVPTPNYTELFLGVFNGQGSDAYSFRYTGEPDSSGVSRLFGRTTIDRQLDTPGQLLFVPRLVTAFDLTDCQTLELGASAALGPNDTGEDKRSIVYGLDEYWKWKPANAEGGWPFVTWQTEILARNFEAGADPTAGLPAADLHDWGWYSQVQWGFVREWVAGFRVDYVDGDHLAEGGDPLARAARTRVSPAITWFPSEFSKLRLQYNHEWRQFEHDADAVWLQFEYMIGSHAAHKF